MKYLVIMYKDGKVYGYYGLFETLGPAKDFAEHLCLYLDVKTVGIDYSYVIVECDTDIGSGS